ncbi:DedA family protein [Nonomuraea muscovyensis]|uniref:Membrane protein DedA with SNARE-associated domain n=1 Tax=Nonomuraea muscovyensis TaxID=1124761 RepID=A0A7X0CDI7_9ACTN|nr:DedA family protein [Nonomuraea muscovyensis]MBB6352201.1 membrane protein DedA with SNARE-associated domain [Nonomuraea muscovyensis]
MTAQNTDGVVGWATGLMESLGAPGAGLIVALENVFPPLPSEVILPLAGFTAGKGEMALWEVLVWTTIGALAGALVLYGAGALLGKDRTHALAARIPLLKPDDLDKAEGWFDRHGRKTVFFGRMVPVFRSVISVPAGLDRMPLATFAVLTALGSLIWNTALVLAGYLLGDKWEVVDTYMGIFTYVVLGLVALALAGWIWRRVAESRRAAARH